MNKQKQYLSALEFSKTRIGWPKYSALRKLIQNRHTNGFDKVVWKVDGIYRICPEDFEKWVENHKNKDI